jgi:thiol-disulfide isomerase/thioredoxin
MPLISDADQARLRASFREMHRRVRLLFFTQTLGCETCLQTRQILDELPLLTDRIVIEEINFVLEPGKAAQYGVDRVPAIAVLFEEAGGAGRAEAAGQVGGAGGAGAAGRVEPAVSDSRIRFLGAPAGYEFISLVQAVLLAGGRASTLTPQSLSRIASVDSPVTVRVFTTPTCPHCPRAVTLAHEMAFASPHITAYAVEATEFPDLARRYQVNGVPKTIVDDDVEILGALPEDAFVEQALAHAAHRHPSSTAGGGVLP